MFRIIKSDRILYFVLWAAAGRRGGLFCLSQDCEATLCSKVWHHTRLWFSAIYCSTRIFSPCSFQNGLTLPNVFGLLPWKPQSPSVFFNCSALSMRDVLSVRLPKQDIIVQTCRCRQMDVIQIAGWQGVGLLSELSCRCVLSLTDTAQALFYIITRLLLWDTQPRPADVCYLILCWGDFHVMYTLCVFQSYHS